VFGCCSVRHCLDDGRVTHHFRCQMARDACESRYFLEKYSYGIIVLVIIWWHANVSTRASRSTYRICDLSRGGVVAHQCIHFDVPRRINHVLDLLLSPTHPHARTHARTRFSGRHRGSRRGSASRVMTSIKHNRRNYTTVPHLGQSQSNSCRASAMRPFRVV
jgi:hypothetical protein